MAVTDTFTQRIKAQLPWPALAFHFACDCFVHRPDHTDSWKRREKQKKGHTGNLGASQASGGQGIRQGQAYHRALAYLHLRSYVRRKPDQGPETWGNLHLHLQLYPFCCPSMHFTYANSNIYIPIPNSKFQWKLWLKL